MKYVNSLFKYFNIPLQEKESWNRHGLVNSDGCQQNLSLFVHECVELQLSLLNEATDRSSTGDDSDENENLSLLRLQRGTVLGA